MGVNKPPSLDGEAPQAISEVARGRTGAEHGVRNVLSAEVGKRVKLERVTDPDDPRLKEAHAIMDATFKPSERDPIEVTQTELREHPGRYVFVVGADEVTGEVVAMASGAPLPLLDRGGVDMGENAFCGCYIAVKPEYRSSVLRIGDQLFAERIRIAKEDTERQGRRFAGYFAEGSEREPFFNRNNAKRAYIQTSPSTYEEVPYYQPPTAWNAKGSGIEELDDGGTAPFERYSAPEHLVYAFPPGESGQTLPVSQLMRMVRGMFWYNSRENHFLTDGSPESLRILNACVDTYEDELERFLSRAQDGHVHLLSAEQRAALRKQGVTISEHRKEMVGE